ncbi:MAG: tetratricopeptide repeat protein [Bacteroidota bacterium]
MITVLKGTSESLFQYVEETYKEDHHFLLTGCREFAPSFVLLRQLIQLAKQRRGEHIIRPLLEKHRIALSLLSEDLVAELSPADQQAAKALQACLHSNITHSRVAKLGLTRPFIQLILDISVPKQTKLIIPDISLVDTGSIDLLRGLYQKFPKQAPSLIIGYDPDWEPTRIDKQLGIGWYRSFESVTFLQSFVYSLEEAANSTIELEASPTRRKQSPPYSTSQQLAGIQAQLEGKALQAWKKESIEEADAQLLFQMSQKSFQLYDFTNALRFGLPLYHKQGLYLTDEQKAKLYNWMALSAHNRQFFSQGNQALAGFLEDCYGRALQLETNPAIRIALLYRQIVTHSRRQNVLDKSNDLLRQAHRELEQGTVNEVDRKVLAAWIHNVHSFVLMKEKKIQPAIDSHEQGFALLDSIALRRPASLRNEVQYSKAVLAENLSTLYSIAGNFPAMKHWYAVEASIVSRYPSLSTVSSAEWQSYYFQNFELQQALRRSRQGWKKARASFNYVLEYFFTLSLADIYHRMGQYPKALIHFDRAIVGQQRLGHSYTHATAATLQCCRARVLLQSGAHAAAANRLQQILQSEEIHSIGEQLQMRYLLAESYAHLGLEVLTEQQVNKAIETALEEGVGPRLFQTCLAAARTCRILGRKEEAIDAYRKAQQLLQTTINGQSLQIAKGDLAKLYLGLAESLPFSTESLGIAITSMAAALKEDASSWDRLADLLLLVKQCPEEKKQQLIDQHPSAFKQLTKAVHQRADCKKGRHVLDPISMVS